MEAVTGPTSLRTKILSLKPGLCNTTHFTKAQSGNRMILWRVIEEHDMVRERRLETLYEASIRPSLYIEKRLGKSMVYYDIQQSYVNPSVVGVK